MKFWKPLESLDGWKEAIRISHEKPVLVLKHSTRCSISQMALDRINRNWTEADSETLHPYYLDLLSYRDISNAIAVETGVEHQSPQVLLIQDGKVTFSETHHAIRLEDVRAVAAKN